MATRRRMTRKPRRGSRRAGSLDVRSAASIGKFEKLLSQGPLTLVLIYADWCGACHRFRDEVWSPLTSLKNATVNRAAVRDDMVAKTSLANVEKKFYPTLLLVGSDKKPATFPSEEGGTTNAMPRQPSLEEDLKTLTTLVNSPEVSSVANNVAGANSLPNMSIKPAPEVGRSVSPGKSPFEDQEPIPTVVNLPTVPAASAISTIASETMAPASNLPGSGNTSAGPPDIGSDLVASQNRAKTGTQAVLAEEPQKGGRMLKAIRRATASLRAMINLRQSHMRTRRAPRHRR